MKKKEIGKTKKIFFKKKKKKKSIKFKERTQKDATTRPTHHLYFFCVLFI